ncbi:hypothetical protein CBM2633_A110133 [Cupriavidus taiwanensis]|uniref:Uncharacterized protein n=1 Tax=Cupriavidus taiwanensis TaxID=164546 RepID=A0A976G2N3_9BURK|nr:hypothetical protein CBM2604_A120410 [Cupriavidus taiwanensis]SOZ25689.1 hypothetical protein CBM2609_A140414 [Cupriavidus taiwanensis]SOZ56872.1 hypothetical protein CBM2615_A290062 [Cupriavidus taiwanensis]SOZ57442.1 hypothetical protein CBM2614_A250433 [Cupriavidus taiwanensis]SOZ60681.1 hypothetical protein CBM2613_A260060 [Cupriavidus taiwanensis]
MAHNARHGRKGQADDPEDFV